MTRTRQWTASKQQFDLAAPPPDRRICECGRPIGEHDFDLQDFVWLGCQESGCLQFKEQIPSTDFKRSNP